ncbi:spore germination protein [Bacillus sp. CRN 9]|nr:spore germination protein [Bacillus sp. CRN 9]
MINNQSNQLSISLEENIDYIQNQMNNPSDLIVRKLILGDTSSVNAALFYIEGIVKTQEIQEYIISPLLSMTKTLHSEQPIEELAYHHINSSNVKIIINSIALIEGLLKGKTILLFDNCTKGILADTTEWEKRGLEEAIQERAIRGPIIGFNEKITTNVNLLRSIIQTPDFCVESKQIGRLTKTDISIVYIKGLVDEIVLEEVRKRINKINLKYLIESRVIEDTLEGNVKTIFPLVLTSERPDSTSAALFEGRVAILVNGTPHAIIVPALLNQFFQVSDEYYLKFGRFTNRSLRFLSFFFSVYLPGIYLSMVEFHKGIIPNHIVQNILGKDEILLPVFWQVILLLMILQLLMDGSFRLPRSAVLVVSLIGSIFIGEAAVNAKFINNSSIIFMGLSYLGSFVVLSRGFEAPIFGLRMIYILLGHFFGFMGLIVGSTIIIIYVASLRSVGVPYLAPLIPFKPKEMKDILYRGKTKILINSKHSYPNENDK